MRWGWMHDDTCWIWALQTYSSTCWTAHHLVTASTVYGACIQIRDIMRLVKFIQVEFHIKIWERVSFGMKSDPLHSLRFYESEPAHSCVANEWGSVCHDVMCLEDIFFRLALPVLRLSSLLGHLLWSLSSHILSSLFCYHGDHITQSGVLWLAKRFIVRLSWISPFIFSQHLLCLRENEDFEVCNGGLAGLSDNEPGGCMQGAFRQTAHPSSMAWHRYSQSVAVWLCYLLWLAGSKHCTKICKTASEPEGRQATRFGSCFCELDKRIKF